jgi:hypothetical protein
VEARAVAGVPARSAAVVAMAMVPAKDHRIQPTGLVQQAGW